LRSRVFNERIQVVLVTEWWILWWVNLKKRRWRMNEKEGGGVIVNLSAGTRLPFEWKLQIPVYVQSSGCGYTVVEMKLRRQEDISYPYI